MQDVRIAIDNPNDLRKLRIAIGPQGCGKTRGYGANMVLEGLLHGLSSVVITVDDGDMIHEVRDAWPSSIPLSHCIDLDLSRDDLVVPVLLNDPDIGMASNFATSTFYASQAKTFLDKVSSSPTTDRMANHYVTAARAVRSVYPNASLVDDVRFLIDADFRHDTLSHVTDKLIQLVWTRFDKKSNSMKEQIIDPILQRVMALMNNPYVARHLVAPVRPEADRQITMRHWMDGDEDGPYLIAWRIPKSVFLDDGIDLLAHMLITKTWLAALSRLEQRIDDRKTTFLILDEPHQYLGFFDESENGQKSIGTQILAEGRKWGIAPVFMFHAWVELPPHVQKMMLSNHPNITLFSAGSSEFHSLKQELAPFTEEEYLRVPKHWALNSWIMPGSDGVVGRQPAFLLKMAAPPTMRFPHQDRTEWTQSCTERYAVEMHDVELRMEEMFTSMAMWGDEDEDD